MEIRKKLHKMAFSNGIPARYIVTFLGFLTFCIFYGHRVVINVAIVAMVNTTDYERNRTVPNENLGETCEDPRDYTNNTLLDYNYKKGEFFWPPSLQGVILGSFFYGFIATQLIAGVVTEKFGAKTVFTTTLLVSSIATMLIPFLSYQGAGIVIVLRTLTGLAQGIAYPAMYTLFSRWSPVEERSTLVAYCWTGNNIGTIVAMTSTGYLCEYGFGGGWPSAFYVFGSFGCVMFFILFTLLYERPEEHPRISNKELLYIQQDQINLSAQQKNKIPWKGIITSGAVWSLASGRFATAWMFFTFLTKLPAYIESVLHFPIQKNGWMNALFHFLVAVSTLLSGYIADFIRKRNFCSLTVLRKSFGTGARLMAVVCLLIVTQIGCNKSLSILLLAIAMFSFGLNAGGDIPMVMDMANNYAGVLFGLINGFACLAGVLSPLAAGLILDENEGSLEQWNIVFYLSMALGITGTLIFLLMGSAEVQPWARKHTEENRVKKVEKEESITSATL